MALYAVDEDDLINASDAEKGKVYWCLECFGPVKVRRGTDRFFHFYHLQASPACRLYSKGEDHLRAQIELEKSFPKGAIQVERSFIEVNRVADLCWEKEKIIFEIQCSLMSEDEAAARIRDYKTVGYDVVWLLDDKLYNKKILRPAERFLRQNCCYFLSLKRGKSSHYYDQYEIFIHGRRIRKGKPTPIDLQKIRNVPQRAEFPIHFPAQTLQLLKHCPHHFLGDRIHRALLSEREPDRVAQMEYWRDLELEAKEMEKKPHFLKELWTLYFLWPYREILKRLLKI